MVDKCAKEGCIKPTRERTYKGGPSPKYCSDQCRKNAYKDRDKYQIYGISQEIYDAMLESQNGCCAICGSIDSKTKRSKLLCVDHDHVTGVARGLLCHPCNSGIGLLEDDIETLQAAIRYLEVNRGQEQ